ncbi:MULTISPECIES: hypothetical protein [unclassified Streptomyces]|uniref:hypothetical protein n=1 Tax=unclassified Streptomyces TaxID=2593676 RepID=UPI00109E42A6|nr:hypothetical protein [Streptomyces sp. A1136]THA47739.1 hypothetical protein E6R62_30700 [Streptomyces sp. A1136]
MSPPHGIPAPGSTTRPFVLRKEVAAAYLAPSLTAGLGGVLTGQPELTIAAITSIGATSALVAGLVGAWLHRRPRRWTTSAPRLTLVLGLTVAAASVAGALGWFASEWLPSHTPVPDSGWLQRLRIDLPLSAALAAAIVTWRWHGATSRQRT